MTRSFFLMITCLLGFNASASALLIGTDTVDGQNNLYHSSWGHRFDKPAVFNHSGRIGNNSASALGRGNAARAFEVDGSSYGFLAGDVFTLNASGCVVDSGTRCTGPGANSGLFRDLPVYSLIGLWSTEAASIVALDLTSGNPAFLIGDYLEFTVPDFSAPLYLFMATNDGIFSDNSGAYSVRLDNLSQVPVPPVIYLVMLGLILGRIFVLKKAGFTATCRH